MDNISKDNTGLILAIYPRLIQEIIVKRFGKISIIRISLLIAHLKVIDTLRGLILLYSQTLQPIENPILKSLDNIILSS